MVCHDSVRAANNLTQSKTWLRMLQLSVGHLVRGYARLACPVSFGTSSHDVVTRGLLMLAQETGHRQATGDLSPIHGASLLCVRYNTMYSDDLAWHRAVQDSHRVLCREQSFLTKQERSRRQRVWHSNTYTGRRTYMCKGTWQKKSGSNMPGPGSRSCQCP